MSREERQRLLHDGTSQTTTMSAYVEIVFDSKLTHLRNVVEADDQMRMVDSQRTIPNCIYVVQSV
jgi:hypothetical protein